MDGFGAPLWQSGLVLFLVMTRVLISINHVHYLVFKKRILVVVKVLLSI